jgi:ABC-type dipeptide/oligopeptide/nickel transport system permease subunit
MKHQLDQVFHSPKFLVGFILFVLLLIFALLYPTFSPFKPLQLVSNKQFTEPGTYINVVDAIDANNTNGGNPIVLDVDTVSSRIKNTLDSDSQQMMIDWLYTYGGVEQGTLSTSKMSDVLTLWQEKYNYDLMPKTLTKAERNRYQAINSKVNGIVANAGHIIADKAEDGTLEQDTTVNSPTGNDFVNVNNLANTVVLPLGSDNFGRDEMTELASAIGISLRIGLIAGIIATATGLVLGLLSGYVGGQVDNIIMFITNLFTVIPGFVILILIANSLGSANRGVTMVAIIIGLTAWPWTCRSVRSQVISLRNRDHVNISKLSGHSMPRIIACDILPYVASYVVMALILQISSGILAEANLSMLGLGPSTTEYTTLGLMMNWATQNTAHMQGAWWALFPVIISIALITFSLNLMNTGLDQVFNPQLRD